MTSGGSEKAAPRVRRLAAGVVLLHAFAGAGQPSADGLRLHLGPSGVLVWTETAQVDRSEPRSQSDRYSGEIGCIRGSPDDGCDCPRRADGEPGRHVARGSCLQLAARNLVINLV